MFHLSDFLSIIVLDIYAVFCGIITFLSTESLLELFTKLEDVGGLHFGSLYDSFK